MLVIVSDLHFTDGSRGATVSPRAFSLFLERLRESAVAASWRTDGRYRPIERLDLVLLGDVLDVIRSARWLSLPGIRPWGNPHAPQFIDQVTQITTDILSVNESAMAALRELATEGQFSLPATARPGHSAQEPHDHPVSVRIHYMVGNRDWVFHLPGSRFDNLRQTVVRYMGLANRPDRPFPHDANESESILQVMRQHKVAARHGDLYDPLSFDGDRDASSVSDAIVVELIQRFCQEVSTRLGNELPATILLALAEIDDVRPLVLVPVWLDGLLERACPNPSLRKRIKTIWDQLVDELLSLDFLRERDGLSPQGLVDGLERALKFSKRLPSGWATGTVRWLNRLRGSTAESYYLHALAEPDFRSRRARHLAYGHTHAAESVPLDASHAEGYVLNQMYFNAGTWRRVYRQTQWAPGAHEFIASDVMTYLVFFQGDERKGRPYETWSGTLGFHPIDVTIHRIDSGRSSHAPGQSISASSLHQHAPHFPTLPAQPGLAPARRV